MNTEMKHNGQKIFNGTTGPPYFQQQNNLNYLNQNNNLNKTGQPYLYTASSQIRPSSFHLNLKKFNCQTNFCSSTNHQPELKLQISKNNCSVYPFNKGLYRINSALNLDHSKYEGNLKREFGSVSSIDTLTNNLNNYNIHPTSCLNENNTHFPTIKEYNNHNLYLITNNHQASSLKVKELNSKNQTEMSNWNNQINLNIKKLNNERNVLVNEKLNDSNSITLKTNALLGSNLALNETCVAPSPRLKKKIHKLFDNKSDKYNKQKLKMSETNNSSNNELISNSTKAYIFRKFSRIGSSKNVNCNINSNNNHLASNDVNNPTLSEEFRSLNSSNTRIDDPEIRFEEKLRKKAFAHYDCQSITANLNYASRLCHLLSKRRNTTTGASAASMVSKLNLNNLDLNNSEIDNGDDRSNDLVLSCPFFRNELGGEEERIISLNRMTAERTSKPNKGIVIYRPNMTSGLALLEDANERRWKLRCCPYQKFNFFNSSNLEHTFFIENSDVGATYYREHFYGLEHQNWFGLDDNLGPIAISIRRERVPIENCSNKNITFNSNDNDNATSVNNSSNNLSTNANLQNSTKNQYRLIIRTSELNVLRGIVFEDCIPSLNLSRNNHHNNHHAKEILEYIAPEINLSNLRLGVSNADEQLLRLDEQAQTCKYKVGILYCKAGQSTEEEMYNNETGSSAFDEFLICLGKKVRLKGFDKYRAGLDNKSDTTGIYSVYSTFAGCEIMFHVSTLLPYTPNNKQQLLRKRHIGNDIVTIVFQEPDACQFTPKSIRSHFQHVFIIIKVLPNINGQTKYAVAISRSKEVPVFGPPIPENGIFTKSKHFTDFLLSKIINAENAAHRSEKFRSMAQRTRFEYLKDLAQNYITNTTINEISIGNSASAKFVSIFSGNKKSRSNRAGRDCHFIGDAIIKGAICWEMCVEDFGQSKIIDCIVGISSDSLIIIEESSKELIFVCPNISILGWSSHPNYIKIFYHQGEYFLIKCKDPDLDEINEIVNRLKNVTSGCETQEIILKRNNSGQLGFHVGFDGIVTQVELYAYAWQSGLRKNSRIVEICKVAIATLSYEQMQDLLKTSLTVSVTILPPLNEQSPRRGCNIETCTYVTNPISYQSVSSNYENINTVFNRIMHSNNRQQVHVQQLNGQLRNGFNLNYPNHVQSLMPLNNSSNNVLLRNNCSSPSSNSSITSKSLPVSPDQACKLSINSLSSSSSVYSSLINNPRFFASPSPYQNTQINTNISNNSSISNISCGNSSNSGFANNSNTTLVNGHFVGFKNSSSKFNSASNTTSIIKQSNSIQNTITKNSSSNSNTSNNISNNNNSLTYSSKISRSKTVLDSNTKESRKNSPVSCKSNNGGSLFTSSGNSSTTSSLARSSFIIPKLNSNGKTNFNSNSNNTQNQHVNSTLQEDLLRLIVPDSYHMDNVDNLSEINSNSSSAVSGESSTTQYSTPYSSLERSNTSCSNKEFKNEDDSSNQRKVILTTAQPAQVILSEPSSPNKKNTKIIETIFKEPLKLSSSNDFLCTKDNSNKKEKNESELNWSNSIDNDSSAKKINQQASNNKLNCSPSKNKISNIIKNKVFDQTDNDLEALNNNHQINEGTDLNTMNTINRVRRHNSINKWINNHKEFSESAPNSINQNNVQKIEKAEQEIKLTLAKNNLDLRNVKNLEEQLKSLQSSKILLEEQVKHLLQENQRLHEESQTCAAKLRNYTEWFFQKY